jgi:23S rRNA (adenine2503-C2)-methyltransferase
MKETSSIYEFSPGELEASLKQIGQPAFRAKQIFDWLYKKGVHSVDQMSNLPKAFRQKLNELHDFSLPEITDKVVSTDGTIKYRLQLADGLAIEAVNMPDQRKGTSLSMCISSQVGCALGCTFCATGTMGHKRDLTVGEIVAQVVLMLHDTDFTPNSINVLFMGMGEPLLNLAAVKKAISIFNDSQALDIAMRRITVSTVGIPHLLPELFQFERPPKLAWSLHAPDEELRRELMPVSGKYTIQMMLEAISKLDLPTRARVTVEYVLLKDKNDRAGHAEALARLLRGMPVKVNLIPYNSFEGNEFHQTSEEEISNFMRILTEAGLTATVRRSRGRDAAAACGQLVVSKKP